MDEKSLLELSGKVRALYLAKGDLLFEQGEDGKEWFYIMRQGSVELKRIFNKKEKLIDICDEGDVFGVRPMLTGQKYITSALASEDSLIFAIPIQHFLPILKDNSRISLFFAAGFAAGQPVVRAHLEHTKEGRLNLNLQPYAQGSFRLDDIVKVEGSKKLVYCKSNTTIKEAAIIMSENGVGSIVIVDQEMHPLGIVTDKDFRNQVVSGNIGIDKTISTIMSTPVICVAPSRSLADILIEMMQHKVHHLCITADGSDQSPALGMVSEHDLLLLQGNNPAVLVREINKAKAIEDLASISKKASNMLRAYLEQELSIPYVSGIMTQINDAIIRKAIQFAEQKMDKLGYARPPLNFCWISLGSEGREEQLLRTDQDNAIIYAEPPIGWETKAKNYFVKLGEETTSNLELCGFEPCPSFIMASNPQWCQDLKGWQRHFDKWIAEPDEKALMHATIFFDFRAVYGDKICRQLSNFIFEKIEKEKLFLNFLQKCFAQSSSPKLFQEFHSGKSRRAPQSVRYQTQGHDAPGRCCSRTLPGAKIGRGE